MKKSQVPRYDERFRGYGMNKIAHIAEVHANGTEFFVLPEVFVMAIRREKSKDWKKTFRDSKKERLIEMQALFNLKREELKKERESRERMKSWKLPKVLSRWSEKHTETKLCDTMVSF